MKRKEVLLFFVFVLLILLFPFPGGKRCWGEILTLKNGKFIHSEKIVSFSEEGITVSRFGGGVVSLTWDQIREEQAKKLRIQLGIDSDEKEGIFFDGQEILMKSGAIYRGQVLSKSKEGMVLKTRSGNLRVPLSEVEAIQEVRVNALEVESPEDLYKREMEKALPETAEEHFELADFCRKITAYEKAKLHMEECARLDPEYRSAERENLLKTLEVFLAHQALREQMDEIRRFVRQGKYDEAMSALKEFNETCEVKEFLEELKRDGFTEDGLEERKLSFLQAKVAREWHVRMREVARKKAVDPKATLNEVRKYAAKEMTEEIVNTIAAHSQIDPNLVVELWKSRKASGKNKVSYGDGTFIVEKSKVKKTVVQKGGRAGDLFGIRSRSSRDERGRRRSRNEPERRKQSQAKEKEMTPDEWWSQATVEPRKSWLTAFYVENSGMMEIIRIDYRPCPSCWGKGYREVVQGLMGEQGYAKLVCSQCQGVGNHRIVVYR